MAKNALKASSSLPERDFATRNTDTPNELRHFQTVPAKPGIRLLSFDDGGARGLSMLLVLRNMLRDVEKLSQGPGLPCDYFDVIAGSGTGGLLALLLGRLRLSMNNAIECYTRIVERVFLRTKPGGQFKASSLEEVLREISNRFGDGDETQMIGDRRPRCRTFVCVREKDNAGVIKPQRLRTYVHPAEPPFRSTLTEAVRATMGNPVFFEPLSITYDNGNQSTFLDAGEDRYNPVFDLYEEALSLFPSRDVAYVVSLGAGKADTINMTPPGFLHQPRLPSACLTAMQHLATRCDAISDAFQRENPELDSVYFRFTHDRGSVNGKMALWEQVAVLKEFLRPYIIAVDEQAFTLVRKMMHERNLLLSGAGRRSR
ncbi:FabD/lysophospholipase-like protein [Schizophyllum commune Tattone D]|nr:FabD/lysophospholipase-like protein [Schizophyllum commune Tattone D]